MNIKKRPFLNLVNYSFFHRKDRAELKKYRLAEDYIFIPAKPIEKKQSVFFIIIEKIRRK